MLLIPLFLFFLIFVISPSVWDVLSAGRPAPSHPPPPVPPVREDSLPVGDCAADSPPPPLDASGAGPTYTKVYLERGADGLGFSIVGGRGNPQGDLPIFVKSVFDRGAAAQSGLLRPGDQIHAVDDILLEGKTHQEAVALLKNAKGTVTLTIVS